MICAVHQWLSHMVCGLQAGHAERADYTALTPLPLLPTVAQSAHPCLICEVTGQSHKCHAMFTKQGRRAAGSASSQTLGGDWEPQWSHLLTSGLSLTGCVLRHLQQKGSICSAVCPLQRLLQHPPFVYYEAIAKRLVVNLGHPRMLICAAAALYKCPETTRNALFHEAESGIHPVPLSSLTSSAQTPYIHSDLNQVQLVHRSHFGHFLLTGEVIHTLSLI